MDRRKFVQSGAGVVTVSLVAGCSDILGSSGENKNEEEYRREIDKNYTTAMGRIDIALLNIENGIRIYEGGSYSEAQNYCDLATEPLNDTKEDFQIVKNSATELDNGFALSAARNGLDACDSLREAKNQLYDASEKSINGEGGEEAFSSAKSAYNTAESISESLPRSQKVDENLG